MAKKDCKHVSINMDKPGDPPYKVGDTATCADCGAPMVIINPVGNWKPAE